MFERRSLKWPITLGVVMIVLLVVLTVGWVLLTVFGALNDWDIAGLYLTLLTVGTVFFVTVLVGVIIYLALTVKAVNLNRRQANFVDSVTHELKSPIASLKLYLQTLNRHQVTREQQAVFYRSMLEDVERLDHLINHMLDAARLDKPQAESELEDVALDSLLQRCAQETRLRNRAEEDSLEVKTEPVMVRARPVDLDMIFRNLIDNAFKYAGEPPRVEVVCEFRDDDSVVTLVKDNGRGVPLRFRHKIFGRFVRIGVELQRDKTGTGLGLYIVHTLVRRLRGRIKVRDRGSGSGTAFEISLPGKRREAVRQKVGDAAEVA